MNVSVVVGGREESVVLWLTYMKILLCKHRFGAPVCHLGLLCTSGAVTHVGTQC